MAIVVEQKQGGTGLVSVLIWAIIIGIIVMGAYYVFVKNPEVIPIAPSKDFKEIQGISRIKFTEVDGVMAKLDPPHFDSHITILPASTTGRANPFLGF